LTELIADLLPEHIRGPVEATITKTLAKERDDGIQRLSAAMRTGRYQRRDAYRALPTSRAAAAWMEDRTAVHRRGCKEGQDRGQVGGTGQGAGGQTAIFSHQAKGQAPLHWSRNAVPVNYMG
jgi:hypothetical protein